MSLQKLQWLKKGPLSRLKEGIFLRKLSFYNLDIFHKRHSLIGSFKKVTSIVGRLTPTREKQTRPGHKSSTSWICCGVSRMNPSFPRCLAGTGSYLAGSC